MTIQPSPESTGRVVAQRMTRWARGDGYPFDLPLGSLAEVLCESHEAAAWLAHPATGLVGGDTMVFAPRDAAEQLGGAGTWVGYDGGFDEPGDEIALSRDFYVQMIDFCAVRYMGVVGPTIVRITGADDARELASAVDEASATGRFPEALRHPLVEVADRCAITRRPCAPTGPTRLHVSATGEVRTSQFGDVVGLVGDGHAAVEQACAGPEDRCLPAGARAALADLDVGRVRQFLATLDALRLMDANSNGEWRASGFGGALTGRTAPATPSADVALLGNGREHVLYHAPSRRCFSLTAEVAAVLETAMPAGDQGTAARLLSDSGGASTVRARQLVDTVDRSFAARGIQLWPQARCAA